MKAKELYAELTTLEAKVTERFEDLCKAGQTYDFVANNIEFDTSEMDSEVKWQLLTDYGNEDNLPKIDICSGVTGRVTFVYVLEISLLGILCKCVHDWDDYDVRLRDVADTCQRIVLIEAIENL
jgi:hypothetical protein